MYQLISRPTVYLVIGIGVLALLVSQFRSADNQMPTSSSELDPFSSLEDLSGRNLATSTPNWEATTTLANVNPIELVHDQIANQQEVRDEMVRDEMTSANSYLQTAAGKLSNDIVEVQSIDVSPIQEAVESALQLSDVDAGEATVALGNQFGEMDSDLTVLELDKPIELVGEASENRYQLEDTSEAIVETEKLDLNPTVLMEDSKPNAEPTAAVETMKARIGTEDSMRPRGWRKNPYISQSNDAIKTNPTGGSLEFKTSGNQNLPEPQSVDSIIIPLEADETDLVSPASSFEPENAPSVVSIIPSTDQSMQSVVSDGYQVDSFNQQIESLPIVIGLPESVAHKAVHNIEYGKSLTRRGAAFAARQEFYSSLRILAQAHDNQAGGTSYTRALRDAIIALKEAEDFIVKDTETQIGLNVTAVVESHSTKLIPPHESANVTAIEAMQRYFAFASSQLRVATGQNPVAAEALYCLGKLHTVQAKFGSNSSKLDVAKSIVFHQAALASDQTNFRSANELGVLLANSGRLQESENILKRSLQIQQLPQAWQNLAVVHQRSGEEHLARLAHQEFLIASRKHTARLPQSTIRWVEPGQFNRGTPLELQQGAAQPQPAPQRNTGSPTIGQRLKSLF